MGIEAITFARLLDKAERIVLGTDALASWWALTKKHAKAPSLRVCLDVLLQMPSFRALCHPAERVVCKHV